jgi:sucrose-6-phosphatase
MKFLLVTDLDDTLVGDDRATTKLNQQLLAFRDRLTFIYATGRSYDFAKQLQAEKQLLEPDYWVTGVGTEIFSEDKQDPVWADKLAQQWNRETIVNIARSFGDLIPQALQEQNLFKISFCLNKPQNLTIIKELHNELDRANLSYKLIFSSDRDVDILPHNADKGLAITYLRERLRIPTELTLVCGDSGNDISLFQQETLGVIVSNARSELIDWYSSNRRSNLYLASSPYAEGILEGLIYFNLLG